MKLKTSFFNTGIFLQDLKQHGWISLLYFGGLFFAIPIQLLQRNSFESYNTTINDNLFIVQGFFQLIILFTVPILAGIFLFRYLQEKKSADYIHSLPIRRETLYSTHLISGFFLLLAPICLTTILVALITIIQPTATFSFSFGNIVTWAAVFSFFTIFLFLFTVVVGMITSLGVVQGIFTYIFLVLPTMLIQLILYQLETHLFGFPSGYMNSLGVELWSPLFTIYNYFPMGRFPITIWIIYPILCLVLIWLGLILYRIRSIEVTSQVINFRLLQPVLKVGVTVCSMLLVGAYYSGQSVYLGYFIGAISGYIIVEMAYQKTWKIISYQSLKSFFGYAIALSSILFLVQLYLNDYEDRLPKKNSINGAYLGYSRMDMEDRLANGQEIFTDQADFIDNVLILHEMALSEGERYIKSTDPVYTVISEDADDFAVHTVGYDAQDFVNIFIAYELTNGKLFVREYFIPLDSDGSIMEFLKETRDDNNNLVSDLN
ncbi:hypothetical protein WAK64_14765 [Bacillus spongiae]|uniref:ABC transporter permease n=1 Tax=Bacillus spongiae TaxID=2683610 RepID=A0ABU8HGB5_9BACI